MGEYSFFLSIFNSLLYVLFYGAILVVRLLTNAISMKDLKAVWLFYPEGSGNFISRIGPWKYFLLTGSLDGLNNILVLISSAYLPGALIALLNQTNVLFSMIAALLLLRSRFTFWEVWSVGLLFAGIAATLMPEFNDLHSLHSGLIHYSIMMGLSTLPQAVSVTLKEKLLRPQNPTTKGIDLFVVNSHTSFFQMLLIPLFIPLTIPFDQTNGKPLDEYIRNGLRCFAGYTPPPNAFSSSVDPDISHCDLDPYPYIVYISINLIYNVLILILIKVASGVLCFMTLQAVLPLSVVLFYIHWPFIEVTPFSGWTVSGLVVGMVALGLFQFFSVEKKKHRLSCLSCSLPAFDLYLDSKRTSRV
uniref:EamA domain-containing protein n=1 Tax=Arcella intermedia TaxID=1963864 RepID=A0A6B2L801_9EUKA